MPDMPRTKFNSPWTVANIEAELNGVKDARGSGTLSAALASKVNSSDFTTDQQRQDALEAEDRAALVAQVDGGAKNLVNAPNGSGVRFINIQIALQPGTYYVLFQNVTSTDTGASVCQFGAFAEDNSQASNLPQLKRGDNSVSKFTVTKQTSYVRLYASSSYVGGEGDTVTFTGCMICTASDYAISPAFVPYRPSWQDMWEMIQALQNGA